MQNTGFEIKEAVSMGSVTAEGVAKSVAVCYAVTVVLLAALAVMVTYLPISEGIVPAAVLVITILSVAAAGFMAAKKIGSKGWLCGVVSGLAYIVTLYFIGSLVFRSFDFGTGILTMLPIGAFSGALGGIMGVNARKHTR